jgi:hypothetical protein
MAGGKRKRDSIHETPDVSYITNPDVAHEHTDVPVTPVLWFIGGLVVFAIVMHLAMWAAFEFFEEREQAAERQASPLARTAAERLPPEPRLQLAPGFGVQKEGGGFIDLSYEAAKQGRVSAPQSEYWVVLEQWRHELEHFGWADQQAGTARLPIKEAMRRYAEQQAAKAAGQPAPGASPQPSPSPTASPAAPSEHTPAPSSGGRTTEQTHQ